MKLEGLSRQIALSMAAISVGVTLLIVLTATGFYYVAFQYWAAHYTEHGNWLIPNGPEWVWLGLTTLAGLALAVTVAVRLARRILVPLNSVAEGIRRVAQGDLDARAIAGDRSLHEVALLADDFNALAAQLQRVTREQAFWNAAIAHELRTPVTILRGRLQGLAEGVFAPEPVQFRSLQTQVEGLARLIEDLRAVSLAESGHLDLQLQRTDLAADIQSVVALFAEPLREAGQHAVLELDPHATRCDPVRIRQALLALLENVRRHADPGTIRIRTQVADGVCRLSVDDEGPGVPPALAPHVFEAFRRADNVRSGGSGLGLAVVAAIAHAHGGQTRCMPLGAGTRFELSWPVDGPPARRHAADAH
jgi:signal transduction histidine kinase